MLNDQIVILSKKRKLLVDESTEKSDSPALRHKCCSTRFDILSEDSLSSRDFHLKENGRNDIPDGNYADLVEQNHNSSKDSCLGSADVKFNSDDGKEQSTSFSHSGTSTTSSLTFDSGAAISITGNYENLISPTPSIGYGQSSALLHHSEMHEDGKEEKIDDDELQEFIYSTTNGLIPESHIVSTHSCLCDDAETQPLAARKPTIDQEFEEYFASLML